MGNLCIIPARGGSKRIPRKNIREFLGKPILAYSIEKALQSQLFDEVMVSSDDPEIEKIAKKYGAHVPFIRSKKNANDTATTAQVILEVLDEYGKLGLEFEYVCCLYPTAPLAKVEKLKNGFNQLIRGEFDSVFPIVPFECPIQRGMKINNEGKSEFIWPEFALVRSQDLETRYHDAGQFYWLNVESFLVSGKIITEKTGSIILSKLEVQDIDDNEDWKIAELKYQILYDHGL